MLVEIEIVSRKKQHIVYIQVHRLLHLTHPHDLTNLQVVLGVSKFESPREIIQLNSA